MAKKTSPPSIKKTAFDCPHCGAFTTQYWFKIYAEQLPDDSPTSFIPDKEWEAAVQNDPEMPEEIKRHWLSLCDKTFTGLVFFGDEKRTSYGKWANNLLLSKCYHCKKITVWVHDNIVFPAEKQGVLPNQDLPDDIIQDFEEARTILGLSPRGAAALLRLCIQKLCKFLGEKGKDLDKDIASLVGKGLNPLVQKSLDIVRVIGNEAVHPGVINLNDNRDTANQLFDLINSIADQMISHPNSVQKLYGQLPEEKRKAIEKRDEKAKK
ncbi:MAG: DUF4145 domain-containing protein [Phycisphaerae bacterium]|nr:DUF4145 domain-containing protein [Phycisphaerae bacterium]